MRTLFHTLWQAMPSRKSIQSWPRYVAAVAVALTVLSGTTMATQATQPDVEKHYACISQVDWLAAQMENNYPQYGTLTYSIFTQQVMRKISDIPGVDYPATADEFSVNDIVECFNIGMPKYEIMIGLQLISDDPPEMVEGYITNCLGAATHFLGIAVYRNMPAASRIRVYDEMLYQANYALTVIHNITHPDAADDATENYVKTVISETTHKGNYASHTVADLDMDKFRDHIDQCDDVGITTRLFLKAASQHIANTEAETDNDD